MKEIKCPFCESTDAELFSLFGQTLLGSQYYCNSCRSIYESVRFDGESLGGGKPNPEQSDKNSEENLGE